MNDRIVTRRVATVLTVQELDQVSGGYRDDFPVPRWPGDDDGPGGNEGGGLTGGQPTEKPSSLDPNGPRDPDHSVADF